MKRNAYCLFETPLGWCGIAWTEEASPPAVTRLQLPEATPKMTESRIARKCGGRRPSVPPPEIREVIERISRHLGGDLQDFRDVPVDLGETDLLERQVYRATREIAAGQTRTYGEVAKSLSPPGQAQAVGQALAHNPIAIIIPCHRVLASGGKPGGFSAHGGPTTKTRLLAIEGTMFSSGRRAVELSLSLPFPD